MPDDGDEYSIRQIAPGDNLAGLSLGSSSFVALKTYLARDAHDHHARNLAKTYGVFTHQAPKKAIAYVTLVCGEISVKDVGKPDGGAYHYNHCPAVKIARLAVDRRHGGKGIGQSLIEFALGLISEVSGRVGCRFVVVDAKQEAVGFYEMKCGFTLLDTNENKARKTPLMFLDLLKAATPSILPTAI